MIQIILVVVIFILLLTLGTYFVVKRKVSLNDLAKRMVKINMIYFPENDMVNSEQWMEYLTEKGNTEKERHEKELFILVLTNAITNKLSSLETIRKMYYSGLKYERSNIRRIFGIGNRNISNNTSINTISPTNSLYIPHTSFLLRDSSKNCDTQPNCTARLNINEKSKPNILYPVMISGSCFCISLPHAKITSFSLL